MMNDGMNGLIRYEILVILVVSLSNLFLDSFIRDYFNIDFVAIKQIGT